MIFAGGVGDWRQLANINDPLPQAMKAVVGDNSGWLHMLVWIGLFGLVASFHGIIMGYSRQIFALARAGYLPAYFAGLSPRFNTPHRALLAGGVIGLLAIFSDGLVENGDRDDPVAVRASLAGLLTAGVGAEILALDAPDDDDRTMVVVRRAT